MCSYIQIYLCLHVLYNVMLKHTAWRRAVRISKGKTCPGLGSITGGLITPVFINLCSCFLGSFHATLHQLSHTTTPPHLYLFLSQTPEIGPQTPRSLLRFKLVSS